MAPLWMGIVWTAHALVVMLEWSFTVDLLDSAGGGLGQGLRQMQASLTTPWLPFALSAAAVLAAYHGLVRRRVAETVGEALLMLVMMAGGMWLIADPGGSSVRSGGWANGAALGTLAVAARGDPSAPVRALGGGLDVVFAAAVEAPWCYLEFGDVDWCRDPRGAIRGSAPPACRSPPRRKRARAVTGAPAPGRARRRSSAAPSCCASAQQRRDLPGAARQRSAAQLDQRHGSLLRTLCQSSDASNCRGPTAAEAGIPQRAETWSRLGGLLLILLGLIGMGLLLGYLALHLLAAAIFSLLYLLLAPAVVLAPAFGEGGRAIFRRWLAQLLGAVVAKLLFSFLLGVVLAVLELIEVSALGWWTRGC